MKSRSKLSNKAPTVTRVRQMILLLLVFTAAACHNTAEKESESSAPGTLLPRVLFVTSGISDEEPRPAAGIVTAIQSFNKRGVTVRLEPRDILYDPERLESYSIIILSTFPGYHDADRKYSLSYMSDEELANLEKFLAGGGVLIAGDNTGRNYPDGTDRVTLFPSLNPDNWELSKCYGVSMTEKNIAGFGLSGDSSAGIAFDFSAGQTYLFSQDLWTIVPQGAIAECSKVLATLVRGDETIPAILESHYGKGMAFFLAASGFLQPIDDGGYWSVDQIDKFYGYVLDTYNHANGIKVRLNPWPGGAEFAFSVSLNAGGSGEQYQRIFNTMKDEGVLPTMFMNGTADENVRALIHKYDLPIASSGYSFINFNDLGYPMSVEDILRNESAWQQEFAGFRFPYTQPAFYGLIALEDHGYTFESSISANNLDFIHGAVVPYNLVISQDGYYRSTGILELAPTYHDDYYFLGRINQDPGPDSISLGKDVMVFSKYLEDFWNYAVKPYNGLMVFLGHPRYTGYNEATLSALTGLLKEVKKDRTWIASMEEVAGFRNGLEAMKFYSEPEDGGFRISIVAPPGISVKDVCLKVAGTVKSASAGQGDVTVTHAAGGSELVFDAFGGQFITVMLD